MKSPLPRTIAVAFGVLLVLPSAAVGAEKVPDRRPNILMIVSEDNGPDLGCYGNRFVSTPNLDRLAAEGMRFERAFVPQAGCSQSRAAFLTGLFPHQNGQIGLATWRFQLYRQDTPNVVRSLKAAGYRTGIIGKLHVNPESAFPFDFHEIPGANFARKDLPRYAQHAAEFFAESDGPFFLAVNYPDAHLPFLRQVDGLPKKPLTAADVQPLAHLGLNTAAIRRNTANYLNCMNRLDHLVGDLLSRLREAGRERETMVVYFGDHGSDTLRAKRTCYEGGVRIPLIIRWPGHIAPGQVRRQLVSTLDLVPTFLEVAGLSPMKHLAGRSLLPLLGSNDVPWRNYLFTEFHLHSCHNYHPQRAVRDDRFKLIETLMPGTYAGDLDRVLARDYAAEEAQEALAAAPAAVRQAYDLMRHPPKYQLYDLENDPHEFHNLADDSAHAETLGRLTKRLATWRRSTHDPFLDSAITIRLRDDVAATKRGTKYLRPKQWPFYEYVNRYVRTPWREPVEPYPTSVEE